MNSQSFPPKPGFGRHFRTSPLTDPWEPIYSRRRSDEAVEIALWLEERHCNGRGFVHGGLIAALADNAMGLSYVATRRDISGAVTVSLQLDYLATARVGQWLVISPRVLKAGRSLGFVDALITGDDVLAARAAATFKAIERPSDG